MNQIEQFFEYYGRVLSEGDLPGIADCYTVPGLVLGDENSIAIAELGEVEKAFAGAAEHYRSTVLSYSQNPVRRSGRSAVFTGILFEACMYLMIYIAGSPDCINGR